jgi:uncharacterized protein
LEPIIDMRLRPPGEGFDSLALYTDRERIMRMTTDLGFTPPPSYASNSFSAMMREMDEAGVRVGVITGRHGKKLGQVANETVAGVVKKHPDRFWGLGSADLGDMARAKKDIQATLANEPLCGMVIETGLADEPKYPDDPSLDGLFGDCEDAKLPVLLMSGGNAGPDLSYSSPVHVDRLAARHPNLQIIAAHGCWPWVNELMGIAFRRKNIWVSPDMYIFMPGWQQYVDGANGYLQDRFLFGTAYPAMPLGESVERFCKLPFAPKVLPKLLSQNALRLFGKSF